MRLSPALPGRRAVASASVTAAVALTLGAAACSAAPAAARTASVVRPAASPAATIPGCRTGVWAQQFTGTGRLAWQVTLPVTASTGDAGSLNGAVSPLVAGRSAVFTDGNSLYGLRLGDGHPVWHRQLGPHPTRASGSDTGAVAQLWTAGSAVVALTGVNSKAPALVSLNPATGEVHWRTPLGSGPLDPDTIPVTTDAIAILSTSKQSTSKQSTSKLSTRLTALDLSDGKRRWTRVYQTRQTVVQASGPDLVVSTRTSLTSPVTLTGLRGGSGAAVWERTGFPGWVSMVSAPGGRILLDGVNASPAPGAVPPPVTALSAATGRTLWQVPTRARVTAVWPATAGVAIATGIPGRVYVQDPTARLYLASLDTGKVRWSSPGHTDPETAPLITSGQVVSVATTPVTGTVTARSARTGAVTWEAPITDAPGRYLARPAGPNVLVAFPGASASQPSRLLALNAATGATRATDLLPLTATVGAPLTAAGGGVLAEPMSVSCALPVHP